MKKSELSVEGYFLYDRPINVTLKPINVTLKCTTNRAASMDRVWVGIVHGWWAHSQQDGHILLPNGDRRPVTLNRWHHVDEDVPLELCSWGLHASRKALNAYFWKPLPYIGQVELKGAMEVGNTKLCAKSRRLLWSVPTEGVVRRLMHELILEWVDEDVPGKVFSVEDKMLVRKYIASYSAKKNNYLDYRAFNILSFYPKTRTTLALSTMVRLLTNYLLARGAEYLLRELILDKDCGTARLFLDKVDKRFTQLILQAHRAQERNVARRAHARP